MVPDTRLRHDTLEGEEGYEYRPAGPGSDAAAASPEGVPFPKMGVQCPDLALLDVRFRDRLEQAGVTS